MDIHSWVRWQSCTNSFHWIFMDTKSHKMNDFKFVYFHLSQGSSTDYLSSWSVADADFNFSTFFFNLVINKWCKYHGLIIFYMFSHKFKCIKRLVQQTSLLMDPPNFPGWALWSFCFCLKVSSSGKSSQ